MFLALLRPCTKSRNQKKCTAITYRASTVPEQGFPCEVFPHREKPFFITGNPFSYCRDFLVRKTLQGKPCFHDREGFAV